MEIVLYMFISNYSQNSSERNNTNFKTFVSLLTKEKIRSMRMAFLYLPNSYRKHELIHEKVQKVVENCLNNPNNYCGELNTC